MSSHLVLEAALAGVPALLAARTLRRARAAQGKRAKAMFPGSGWVAHRRTVALTRLRHENEMVRDKALHLYRLAEQQAARRARGTTAPGPDPDTGTDSGTTPRTGRTTVRARVIRLGDQRTTRGGTPRNPPHPTEPPARGGSHDAPRTRRPAPGPTPTPTGGTPMTTPDTPAGVPGVEAIIEGAHALGTHARTGNVQAKRRAILGIAAAIRVLAGILHSLAAAMAEPGQHYGTEVWEPLTTAASQLTAAATVLAETDTRLLTIIRAAEELAASGVQAPHPDEMAVR